MFRADSIVEDAEVLRSVLGADKWTLLGQSFGGFCSVTYLTRYPRSLAGAMLCGGLPSLSSGPDHAIEVYRRCALEVERKTRKYFQRCVPAPPGAPAAPRRPSLRLQISCGR